MRREPRYGNTYTGHDYDGPVPFPDPKPQDDHSVSTPASDHLPPAGTGNPPVGRSVRPGFTRIRTADLPPWPCCGRRGRHWPSCPHFTGSPNA